jgi:hypothetical protein
VRVGHSPVSICVLFFNKNKWDTHNNNNDDDNNKPSRKIGRMREREREREKKMKKKTKKEKEQETTFASAQLFIAP